MSEVFDAEAFTRFEQVGWDRASDGHHGVLRPITARAAAPLLDAAAVSRALDVATGPGHVAARAVARGRRRSGAGTIGGHATVDTAG